MKSLDFDAALPLLEQLKADPSLSATQRSEVLLDLGVTHVNRGRVEEARRDFEDALGSKGAAPLPSSASPRVQRVFEEAGEAGRPKPEPVPPPPPPPQP